MDNYWNKVFTMTRIARLRGYRFLVSLDDDVMLAPSTLAALAASGPALERGGCGVVAPLTQNGVPCAGWSDIEDRRAHPPRNRFAWKRVTEHVFLACANLTT